MNGCALFAPPPRSHAPEWLDQLSTDAGSVPADMLCGNLRDIARYNRWLGANRLMRGLVRNTVGADYMTGLDVGAGLGDYAVYAARSDGTRWVIVDASPAVLRCVETAGRTSSAAANGLALPFPDGSFDAVTCAQTLHHFEPPQAVALLRECARVARRGVVVVDLARGRAALWSVWLLTRLTSRNPMTLADGVQSAKRAYTPDEALELARLAGWPSVRTRLRRHAGGVRYSLSLTQGTSI